MMNTTSKPDVQPVLNSAVQSIAIVDDDEAVRDSLKWLLSSQDHKIKCYANGADFLSEYRPELFNCIILDLRMPCINGLEIFNRLRSENYFPPVIFLSGHADLYTAVEAVKNGASDFFEKPVVDDHLIEHIKALIQADLEKREKWRTKESIKERLAHLTAREYQVMQLMLTGRLNKQVADDLGIAIKTVEVHRSRILEKMNVRSALALSHLLRTNN